MKFYRTFLPTFRGSFEGKNGLQTPDAIFFIPTKVCMFHVLHFILAASTVPTCETILALQT